MDLLKINLGIDTDRTVNHWTEDTGGFHSPNPGCPKQLTN